MRGRLGWGVVQKWLGWWWTPLSQARKRGLVMIQVRSPLAPALARSEARGVGSWLNGMGCEVVRLWLSGRGKKAGRAVSRLVVCRLVGKGVVGLVRVQA